MSERRWRKIGQVEHKPCEETISRRQRSATVICISVPELKLDRSDLTNRTRFGTSTHN
jgi:hypothetical protein